MSRLALVMAAVLAAGAAHAETIAIVGARVETAGPAGALPDGVVIVKDGRIVKVGRGLAPPPGARVIDAAGKVVTPGLIAASTTLMVEEIQGVSSTRDDMARGKLGAAYDVAYGLNPASTLVPLARQGGLTRAFVTPTGGRGYGEDEEEDLAADTAGTGDPASPAAGLFAGQAAGVRLAAGDKDPLFRARAAVTVDLGDAGARIAGSHAGALIMFRTALQDARAFAAGRAAFDRGASRAYALPREDLEALQPVLRREVPLLIRVHRAADIRQVLKIASQEKVRVILEDAEEAWLEADALAAAKVPVLIDAEADLPEQFETLASRLDNAARLQKAGVLVAIEGSRSFGNYRQARLNAGTAVANGLPYEAALRAVTLNPAEIWGVSDQLGSLEAGKAADLVIWSGDPLEISSYPERVFIEGVEQPQDSRGSKLRDRYAGSEGDLPFAYH